MTLGLVHASYSLPKWQAVKLAFFAPCFYYLFLTIIAWGWVSSGGLAKVDNTLRDLHNSSDDMKVEFNIIVLSFIQNNFRFKNKLKHAYLHQC